MGRDPRAGASTRVDSVTTEAEMGTLAASANPSDDPATPRESPRATSSGPIAIDATTSRAGGSQTYSCKKCARGSSCFPVHVATQKLATSRRKRSGRGESPDPEDVWRQFENLLADGHRPTVKTYTSLLSALGDVGAPEDAEEVLARMRDAGEVPDARAYNAAVHAWCANGKPANAERLVEKMLGDGVAPDAATYPDIVAAYATLGDLRRCESIVSRIESVCVDEGAALAWYEKVYHALIRGCCARGSPDDAEKVLQRWNYEQLDMERVAERKGRVSRPVTASYGMIIDHYVSVGAMGDARRLLGQMQWDKVAPSIEIFNMLLKGYLKSGNVGAAQDVFRELEGSGTWDMDSLGIKPDVTSYTSLMDHWANQGDVDLAEKILAKMELKGVAPDERTFGSLVKAYARGRNPEGAEKVLERMRRYDAPDPARTGAGRGGRKEPDWRRKGKRAAAAAAADAKDGERRKKLSPGVILYSTVVSAYAAVGDMANARRVVAEMSDRRVRPNDRTFAHLAWGYGQLGDVAGVTQTAQLMVDEGVSMRPGGSGRQALVRAVRECGLPASHVDRLLDSLAPKRKGAGSRSGVGRRAGAASGAGDRGGGANRWVRGSDNKLRREDGADATSASSASASAASSSSSFDDSVPPPAPSKPRRKGGYGDGRGRGPVTRHGDAGWVMSAGWTRPAGARRRTARGVVARPGRSPVASKGSALGLRARRSAGFVAPARGVAVFSSPAITP